MSSNVCCCDSSSSGNDHQLWCRESQHAIIITLEFTGKIQHYLSLFCCLSVSYWCVMCIIVVQSKLQLQQWHLVTNYYISSSFTVFPSLYGISSEKWLCLSTLLSFAPISSIIAKRRTNVQMFCHLMCNIFCHWDKLCPKEFIFQNIFHIKFPKWYLLPQNISSFAIIEKR